MIPLKAVDVAIGIAFFYLLITFCTSALVEMISTVLNWRARMLHDAIHNMLKQSSLVTGRDIYHNPQVLALCRNSAAPSPVDLAERHGWRPSKGGTPPSYIPPATFSGAVLESLLNKAKPPVVLSPDGAIQSIQSLLSNPTEVERAHFDAPCEEDALRSILLTTLATQGKSIQAVRFAIEKWYSDTMDRTSGWYKRRTQSCLLIIGLVIAFGCNLDTIAVARWLWQGDAARQAAISAASDYASKNPAPKQSSEPTKSEKQTDTPAVALVAQIVSADQQVSKLQYPIGWPPSNWKLGWISWALEYLFGALITAIAISMGSSFWFDAVQNLIKIRGTGPKPGAR